MKDISMLQLVVGTAGAMFLVVSATFAGYWNLFGKKHRSVSRQAIGRSAPPAGTGRRQ